MIRVVPFTLLFAVCLAHATASLAERTQVAMMRVEVRQDQAAQFEKNMNEHYDRCTAMFRREIRTAPEEVDKRVPRLLRTISKNTLKKMGKLLDSTQMEAFEYALDLENRRFMQSNGVHEP
jgi:hypothetical protein